MKAKRLEQIALAGLASLLVAVAIVVLTPPADGYEISIYRAYPEYFWVLVVGALFTGSVVVVGSATTDANRSWVYGLALMLLTNALLVLLPYIRGYQLYGRTDALSHLGYIHNIAESGDIAGNIYPPMHLLVLASADAAGTDPMQVAILLTALFSAIYFGSMFYLIVNLFNSRERVLFGLPFVMLPVLGHAHLGFRPFDWSMLLVPFVIYLFIKGQRNPVPAVRGTFVVSLVALLIYHPLTALFLIGVFTLYFISRYVPQVKERYASPTNLLPLSTTVFLVWYSNFTGIIFRVDRIYETLFGTESGEAPAAAYTEAVNEAQPPLTQLLRVTTFRYGIEFILFGLGFAFLGLALLLLFRDEYALDTHSALFVPTLMLFTIGGLLFLLTDLIVTHHRPFQVAKIGAVLLSGQLFYLLWKKSVWPRRFDGTGSGFQMSLALVLLVLVVLSTFGLYHSPLATETNHQVTEMEVEGSQWLMDHGTATDELVEFKISYKRYYHARNGVQNAEPFVGRNPPPHFNYTSQESFGEGSDEDRYLTVTHHGRILYPQNFPNYREQWQFTPSDFDKLERDTTVSRIYDNGEYNQYLVNGTATTGP